MSTSQWHRVQRIIDHSDLDTRGFLLQYAFTTPEERYTVALMRGLDSSFKRVNYITIDYKLVVYDRRKNVWVPKRTISGSLNARRAFQLLSDTLREAKYKFGDQFKEVKRP